MTQDRLFKRYFVLLARLKRVEFIYQVTYYNETFKIRRLRKIIMILNRKIRILESHFKLQP